MTSANKAASAEIKLFADLAQLQAALSSLELAFKASPEVGQLFLDSLDSPVELCRIDVGDGAALRAGEVRICFEPSDCLRDFLAASGAGDLQLHAVDI